MSLGVPQTATKVLTDAGGSTTAISFGSLPTAGGGVHAWYINAGAANPILDPTVDDNQSHGNYTKAKSANESSAGQLAGLWYLPKIVTSAGTFTVTFHHSASSSNYSLVNISEISTGGGGILLEQSNSGTVTTGTPVTASVTTVVADQVLASAMTLDSSTSNSGIGTAFSGGTQVMVEQNSSLHVSGAGDYKVVSASGGQTASYAITDAHNDAVCVIASYKEVSAGGSSIVPIVDRMYRQRRA